MTETTITTPYSRELTVFDNDGGIFLKSVETAGHGKPGEVQAYLSKDNAKELATALLAAAGETIHPELGELPEVKVHPYDSKYLAAGKSASRRHDADPATVLEQANSLFAIAKELQKRADYKVAEKKAAEAAKAEANAKLYQRRDELVTELSGSSWVNSYADVSTTAQKAIDKIIELEGKVQPVKVYWV